MSNRRQMPRYRQRLEVLVNGCGKLWHRGSTLDFGPAGLCVTCADLPALTGMLQLQILLPDGRAIHMMARPAWDDDERRIIGSRDRRKLGLRIVAAPETWYEFCQTVDRVHQEGQLETGMGTLASS